MKKLLVTIFSSSAYMQFLKALLAKFMEVEILTINYREFPDQESYLKLDIDVNGKDVIIIDSLDNPNHKIFPLLLLAETLRDCGAAKIGFVSPYLAYMRQDKRFLDFEGVTSRYFAKLVSHYFDWLITVDPHLHRYKNLNEIYSIPTKVVHAAHNIAEFIKNNIKHPLIIGPDEESEQWIKEIATLAKAPYLIFSKIRKSDVDVTIVNNHGVTAANNKDVTAINGTLLSEYKKHTPVLVDDIISTAHTMIEAVKHLKLHIENKPICIGIHAIFANDSYIELQKSGVENIITCDTIIHNSNTISVIGEIAKDVALMFE